MSAALEVQHVESSNVKPDRIVLCVCTKDRPEKFQRCLSALLSQTFSSAATELYLIIVDNSAEAIERTAVAQLQSRPFPVIFVHEPVAGIPNARNAALNALESLSPDWIVFIDDDEIAPVEWIARLHAAALDCGADVASGKVIQFATADEALSAAEKWRPQSSFGKVRALLACPTSNVIFRAALTSGPSGLRFDETMRFGGSDTEFFMRASQRGARIFGLEDATVFEEYPAERNTFQYECMRAFRVGANINYRYMKNYGRLRGAFFIAERISYNARRALVCMLLGIVTYPFARMRGAKRLRQGARNAATACGSVGPMLGIRPGRYW